MQIVFDYFIFSSVKVLYVTAKFLLQQAIHKNECKKVIKNVTVNDR